MSGGGSKSQTTGYRYSFGIHAGIGRGPVDELVEIRVGKKLAASPHMTESGVGRISQPELFGGDKKEGGIDGPFNLLMGEDTQTMPASLAAMIAPTVATGYRRMVTFFYDGLIAAMNPYPKPWSFRVRRARKGWDGEVFRPDIAVIELEGAAAPVGDDSSVGVISETVPANIPPLSGANALQLVIDNAERSNAQAYATCLANGGHPLGCPGHGFYGELEYRDDNGGEVRIVFYAKKLGSDEYDVPSYGSWNPAGDPQPFRVKSPEGSLLIDVLHVRGRLTDDPEEPIENLDFSYGLIDPNTAEVLVDYTRYAGRPVEVDIRYYFPDELSPDRRIMAMNPAHIVFEALTNREWGRGIDRSMLSIESFDTAAQTLFDEKLGMCIRWSRRDSIDAFIQEVLDTCGAALYMNRTDGTLTLRLIRKDYVKADLTLWDTTNGILTITSSTVNTSANVINEVIVKYREAVFNEERSVNVQNLASLQSTGGVFKTMTKTYKGLPTSGLARRIAQRDLRANSEGLRRFNITMDRRGSGITPGQVMRIQDAARQIPDMVVRVATVKDGTMLKGEIELLVIQDVFSFPSDSFVEDQPNTWVPQNFKPCIGKHEVHEAPYFLLRNVMSQADFNFVDEESGFLLVVAEQARNTNVSFDLAVKMGAPTTDEAAGTFSICGFDPSDEPPLDTP